jgi:hypothetical protein
VSGADEQRVADPLRDQLTPPIDQRFHQHFADLGVSLNEHVHLIARQLNDLPRLADAKAHECRATEEHAHVTGELTRVNGCDQQVA